MFNCSSGVTINLSYFKEIMILPVGAKNFEEAMQMGSETYHHLKVAFASNILCCRYLYVSSISVLHSYLVQDVHQTS